LKPSRYREGFFLFDHEFFATNARIFATNALMILPMMQFEIVSLK
jgi:hypothetical protein